MKYSNLIEPYLFGHLSPEEEIVFERQLSRDPALAEETARRLNGGQPFYPPPPKENLPTKKTSPASTVLLAGFVALLLGLLWWAVRPAGNNIDEHNTETERPAAQPEVTYD